MDKRIFIFFAALALSFSAVYGQKQTTHVNQLWFAYFNQTRLSDKWGIWADFHLRTKEDFFSDLSTGIVRLGLTHYLSDQVKLTAGYAYINHFPAEAHTGISQPEHRPWQQIQWHTRYKRARVMQYLRLEERFRRKIENHEALAEGYQFNYRFRYNFTFTVPLTQKGFDKNGWALVLGDELHINMGKEITYNYFDQNRFFAGFGYHLNRNDNVQFGYMNLFQQLGTGNRYRDLHAFRVYYNHNIDLRKK